MCKVNSNMNSWGKAFKETGNNIDNHREALKHELSKPKPNEGKVLELRANFDRATRMFEMLNELWKAGQQNLQRIIQNIGGR